MTVGVVVSLALLPVTSRSVRSLVLEVSLCPEEQSQWLLHAVALINSIHIQTGEWLSVRVLVGDGGR